MSERPFMQFYPSDFIGDTMHLTPEQMGAYIRLLCSMWNAGGCLPDDDRKLATISGMSMKKWRAVGDDIRAFFVPLDDALSHNRMTKEIQKVYRKSDSRRSAGAKGGAANALKYKKQGEAKACDLLKHLPEPEPYREKKETKVSQKKGTRLDENWTLPPDWKQWAFDQGLDPPTIQDQADRFKDYWIGKPGQGGVKLDWLATWRNWIRNNRQSNGKGNGNGTGQPKPASASRGETIFNAFAKRAGAGVHPAKNGACDEADIGFSGPTIDGTAS